MSKAPKEEYFQSTRDQALDTALRLGGHINTESLLKSAKEIEAYLDAPDANEEGVVELTVTFVGTEEDAANVAAQIAELLDNGTVSL